MEQARSQAAGFREVFRNPSRRAEEDAWQRFIEVLEDDFNTPAALALMHGWRDHDLLRRALDVFGLASLAEGEDAPAEVVELAKRRQRARAARNFEEADRLRREIEAAGWEARDVADGYQLVPK
jgi:cysteinyl-tRNA synthetase